MPSHSEIAAAGLAQAIPNPSNTISASCSTTPAPRHHASSADSALPRPNIFYACLLLASGSDCKTCLAQSCFWCEDQTPETGCTTCRPICARCARRCSVTMTSAIILLLDQVLSSPNASRSRVYYVRLQAPIGTDLVSSSAFPKGVLPASWLKLQWHSQWKL